MNLKIFIYMFFFVFLCNTVTTDAMNTGDAQQITGMQLLDLPNDSIANIGSFLDNNSLLAFSKTCRRCYFLLAINLFLIFSPAVVKRIMENLTQNDLLNLWKANKLFYHRFVNHEKPFHIRCDNYYPFCPKKLLATHKMVMHISQLVSNAHRRKMPVSLDLAGQSQRADVDSIWFIRRLFSMLMWYDITDSLVELDLSRNFSKELAICLMHRQLINSQIASNPVASDSISTVCAVSPNLTKLVLDGNDLTVIPQQITGLKKLKILSLAWNYLRPHSLEPCRQLTGLTTLDLSSNCLHSIPQFILQLPHLHQLTVTDNPLTKETKQRLEKGQSSQLMITYDKE